MIQFDKYLYRGPRPPSMQWLKDNGFKHVINLQSGAYETFHNDKYESQGDAEFGIKEHNFAMSDFSAPTVNHLYHIADMLDKHNCGEIKTYVHCKFGVDRTGMVVAAYRILKQNCSIEEAIKEMYSLGFHKWPYVFPLNWPKQLGKLHK